MTRTAMVFTVGTGTRALDALRLRSVSLFSLLALLALCATAAAQSGSISGVVKDPQHALVPGAEVVLRNSRSAATPTVVTDSTGRYAFTALQPGTYVVQVYLSGFQVQLSAAILLGGEQSATR